MFEILFAIATGLWVAGAYVDGWAHIHIVDEIESFFTPWHALFYSGIFLTLALLVGRLIVKKSLPREYKVSLVGVAITIISGGADLIWHSIFGIENGIEALLSPTHLLLAIGAGLALSGPLRKMPIIMSTYLFSIITFILQFLHPFKYPWAAQSFFADRSVDMHYGVGVGVAGILVYTAIFMGIVLLVSKLRRMPFGTITSILTLNVLAMVLMFGERYEFVLTALVAGLILDVLHTFSKTELFYFLAPVVLFTTYFLTIFYTDTVVWTTHIWTGAVLMSGITGYLLYQLNRGSSSV